MAQFKPCRVTDDNALNRFPIKTGQFIVVVSTGRMYLDVNDTDRISIGGSDASSLQIPIDPTDKTGLNVWIET